MKTYLSEQKPFLLFLAKFFGTYFILIVLYQLYLSGFKGVQVDGVTQMVAEQSGKLLSLFDKDSFLLPNATEASVKVYVHEQWVARIIEGCNSFSVIILFVSFIVAFTGNFKKTILFILTGSLIIYIFNVVRISLLCLSIYHYPQYEHILHGVIFPLVIYGVVFALWILWINKFSFYAEKSKK